MKTPVSRLRFALPVVLALGPLAVQAGDGTASADAIAAAVAPTPTPALTSDPALAPDSTPAPISPAPPVATPDVPSDSRVTWQGDPIPIALKVGIERRIDFPEPIAEIHVPREVEQRSRLVLTPAGHLHWTAQAPFASTRILATSVSGSLYQLDVTARADGEAEGRIVLTDPVLEAAALAKAHTPDDRAQREQVATQLIPDFLKRGAAGAPSPDRPGYVALARFALAHFTGPERLIPALDATRVAVRPIDTQAWLRVQAHTLTIRPLAQWKVGDRYVTALGVVNRGPAEVPFDPRALRGNLRFAAALHPALGPAGSGHHGSVWAVVSDQPFNRVLDHGPASALAVAH